MNQVIIVPLNREDLLTEPAKRAILSAQNLFLQTSRHPYASFLLSSGLSYTSMDDFYEAAEDFDALNASIAQRLVKAGTCVYAVTGNITSTQLPVIQAEVTRAGGQVLVLPGISSPQTAYPDLDLGLTCTPRDMPEVFQPAINYTIEEIDSALTAGQVKLRLMEYFPEEWEILFSDLDEAGLYQRRAIPLFELDRQPFYGPSAVIHVPAAPFDKLDRFGYEDLCRVIRRLRAPGGCPWDREQTHDSLKVPLMEECYELLDAIDEKNDAHLTEELGDVLMQVVFHDEIAAEQGRFTGRDVTTELVQKLIYRHPHVFGDAMAATSQEVLVNWDKLKKKEKGQITQTDVLLSVPRNLPALTRAKKIQKKAGDVGFDWDSPGEALTKVYEEAREVEDALKNEGNVAEETGDLLFAAVNVIRLAGLDPELTLLATCDKFIQRFAAMEKMASDAGNRLEDLSLSQQDALWNEAKKRRN